MMIVVVTWPRDDKSHRRQLTTTQCETAPTVGATTTHESLNGSGEKVASSPGCFFEGGGHTFAARLLSFSFSCCSTCTHRYLSLFPLAFVFRPPPHNKVLIKYKEIYVQIQSYAASLKSTQWKKHGLPMCDSGACVIAALFGMLVEEAVGRQVVKQLYPRRGRKLGGIKAAADALSPPARNSTSAAATATWTNNPKIPPHHGSWVTSHASPTPTLPRRKQTTDVRCSTTDIYAR